MRTIATASGGDTPGRGASCAWSLGGVEYSAVGEVRPQKPRQRERRGFHVGATVRGAPIDRARVAVSRSYGAIVRLYELARQRGEPARALLERLRADGEWVTSHLSVVPAPILRRYMPTGPPQETTPTPRATRPSSMGRPPSPTAARPLPRLRRRPGPRPITLRLSDVGDDPWPSRSNLRYQPELTTRDVAELLHVAPATVRRWVARGHLKPIRQQGRANVFGRDDVQDAFERISARRRATGQPSAEAWPMAVRKPAEQIPPKHYDALLTTTEAGQLLEISASTIRSWIHRGHLQPVASAAPGPLLIRLGRVSVVERG